MKCRKCGREMKLVQIDGEDWYVCDNCWIRREADSEVKQYKTAPHKISKCLLISLIIGVAYMAYSAWYWGGAAGSGTNTAEQLGAGIAIAVVMPHLVVTFLAVLFNALGCFLKKRGFALTGAILYAVAMVLFPLYFMFVILEMILSFVGFGTMNKK